MKHEIFNNEDDSICLDCKSPYHTQFSNWLNFRAYQLKWKQKKDNNIVSST